MSKTTTSKRDQQHNATPAVPREPDLVDRLIGLLAERHPDLQPIDLAAFEKALREHFGGARHYVRERPTGEREEIVRRVLSEFNGRNASELARRLRIGRSEVYRIIKQPAPR